MTCKCSIVVIVFKYIIYTTSAVQPLFSKPYVPSYCISRYFFNPYPVLVLMPHISFMKCMYSNKHSCHWLHFIINLTKPGRSHMFVTLFFPCLSAIWYHNFLMINMRNVSFKLVYCLHLLSVKPYMIFQLHS